jgi:hypothetical protein
MLKPAYLLTPWYGGQDDEQPEKTERGTQNRREFTRSQLQCRSFIFLLRPAEKYLPPVMEESDSGLDSTALPMKSKSSMLHL